MKNEKEFIKLYGKVAPVGSPLFCSLFKEIFKKEFWEFVRDSSEEKQVVVFEKIEKVEGMSLILPARNLYGKKWRAVFTEIIE